MLSAASSLGAPEQATPRRVGQELGRKGAETRRRLMDAARGLLETMSPVAMTVAGVARAAGTSPATFYVYFDDVGDLVLTLAREASEDMGEVDRALVEWRSGLGASEGAARFVQAFRRYYRDHRAILSIRNMEADRGDTRFANVRSEAAMPILNALGDLIRQGGGAAARSPEDAFGRAIVIYCAIERLAAAEGIYPAVQGRPFTMSAENIAGAEVAMLAELVDPTVP